jgi:hypothetical protein
MRIGMSVVASYRVLGGRVSTDVDRNVDNFICLPVLHREMTAVVNKYMTRDARACGCADEAIIIGVEYHLRLPSLDLYFVLSPKSNVLTTTLGSTHGWRLRISLSFGKIAEALVGKNLRGRKK